MANQKIKKRSADEKEKLLKRTKTIEGQIRGISQMIANDRYCDDILIQISAVNNSLKSLGLEILKKHLATCVVDNIKNDNLTIVDEVMQTIKRIN